MGATVPVIVVSTITLTLIFEYEPMEVGCVGFGKIRKDIRLSGKLAEGIRLFGELAEGIGLSREIRVSGSNIDPRL